MTRKSPLLLAVIAAAALSTACSSDQSPLSPAMDASMAKGVGGSSGGGGGGGGGGGTTVKAGQIQGTSAGAVCDGGSSVSVAIDKGFGDQANVTVIAIANAVPVGPAIPPSSFPTTSLGGTWKITMTDVDAGTPFMGLGTTMSPSTPNVRIQNLGRSVTPGFHTISFLLVNQRTIGDVETCTATLSLFAK
jgi:hypothetical protein